MEKVERTQLQLRVCCTKVQLRDFIVIRRLHSGFDGNSQAKSGSQSLLLEGGSLRQQTISSDSQRPCLPVDPPCISLKAGAWLIPRPLISHGVAGLPMLCRALRGGSKRGRVWIGSPYVQSGSILASRSPDASTEQQIRHYRAEVGRTGPIIRPERVILLRHGESMGNVDEGTYCVVPDWKVPLTDKGHEQARLAGLKIKEIVGDAPLYIYTSPYMRTKQTLARLVEGLDDNTIRGAREEARLTEQAFGNFQNIESVRLSKEERAKFGRFYYRFPDGESGLDVYSRVTSFLQTLYSDFADPDIKSPDLNVIIVTHGLTLRLLVMRWFQFTIADFEESINPPNGELIIVERKQDAQGHQWFELTPDSCELIGLRKENTKGSLWRLLAEMNEEKTNGE